ncbi:MAG: flagellar filament capping protein FliD [Immundisolibacter sp.]
MAGLSSAGIGSGLDVAGLVAKLLDAERTPTLTRLAGKEATLQAQLSGFGLLRGALDKLKSALDGLAAPTLLTANKAGVSDDTRFTASADDSAAPGTYSIEVTALAKAQKLASAAFADANAVVGTGTLTLAVGGNSASVTIDDGNNTLAGIRDAINAARDANGKPLPLTATLVTSTGASEPAGTYLVLTSGETGAANTISVTQTGGDGGLAALQYETGGAANGLTEKEAPTDAVVTVDGFTHASASNTITGALAGVTLNLKALTADPVTLTVTADTGSVRAKVQAVVDAYNGLHRVIDEQAGYDAATGRGGVLIGEPALRNLEGQLRRRLMDPIPAAGGALKLASDLGLRFDASGSLTLDGATFDAVLAEDRGAIGGLLQGDGALVERLREVVDGYLANGDGLLKARTDGIDRRLRDINDQREALDARLAALEARYLAQFNALDSLLSQLTATGDFLTQQLATLPGAKSADK